MRACWAILIALLTPARLLAAEPGGRDLEFFEKKVRPLLADNCYSCHGPEKQKGQLRLDSVASIQAGGESGPVIVPGDPDESRLIRAVRYKNEELKMPPKKRLGERQVADLVEWVKSGAAMPPDQTVATDLRPRPRTGQKPHWAFQSPIRPEVPPGGPSPIDAFLSQKLRAQNLTNNPPASRRELIRRASFDLIGIPPSPEAVADFENDALPNAFERVITRLLASPRYGERWGRYWLDLVRFAQSNGYERDGEKLLAWRYRDYVIRSFNEDKPYDRFVLEQLAGDELPEGTAESVVATGFQRLGVFDDEPDDKRLAEFDALDDVLSTTGTAFLGLTIGCARCHDHKFDPISQAEYYSLLSFFRGVRPFESSAPSYESPGFAPLAAPREAHHWRAWRDARLKNLQDQLAAAPDGPRRKTVEAEIKKVKEDAPYQWTLAVRENGAVPPATYLLIRGNPAAQGPAVEPAFPRALGSGTPQLLQPAPDASSSGRRLALARWIASPEHPLTARVMVNRIWQHHFGEGLVKTPSDFGRAGTPPSHPELLDWLASEFAGRGWSMKKMHQTIMLSAAYQQSSRVENAPALAVDPGNRLVWRQSLRRLEVEAIRDTMLAVAGQLNDRMTGRGFFPHLGGEVLAGQSRPGLDWEVSPAAEQSRRSIYAFIRRTMGVPLFETFDYVNTTSPLAERATTTVAPQSLMLMNDPFVHRTAAAFAARVAEAAGPDDHARIEAAYSLAFNRRPSAREAQSALALLERRAADFRQMDSQINFRVDVPNALSTEYFAQLPPSGFLVGPADGWTYYRGVWAPPYEGIRVVDRDQGPFALWDGPAFAEGVIEAGVLFSASCESASLLLRCQARDDRASGYELFMEPRNGRAQLRHLDREANVLAECHLRIPEGELWPLRIELKGGRISVSLGTGQFSVAAPENASPPGYCGVRVWGGTVTLDHLRVSSSADGKVHPVRARQGDPRQKAWESACLVLLNLNEMMYVD